MSNYQDATNEIAYASDMTWSNTTAITEEIAFLKETLFHGVTVLLNESARANDDVAGYLGRVNSENARLLDLPFGQISGTTTVNEQARLKDRVYAGFQILTTESVYASDFAFGMLSSSVIEKITASDLVFGTRHVQCNTDEKAVIKDLAFAFSHYTVDEQAVLADRQYSQKHSMFTVAETALFTDQEIGVGLIADFTAECLRASDAIWGHLHAKSLIKENAYFDDYPARDEFTGQAWTANTDTWAMSRYAPYDFEGVAILDGQLFLWNSDGVYLSGVEGEHIQGQVKTGKLDFGEQLVHPQTAYLEYSSHGDNAQISIGVTSTQSGQPIQYEYLLPKERSTELTNGKVVLGRGLRGRHFSFDISIQGRATYVNAMSFEYSPTTRRT